MHHLSQGHVSLVPLCGAGGCAARSSWHAVGFGSGLARAYPEELHTHTWHRGAKTHSEAAAPAPSPRPWEAQAQQCSYISPEEKFGRKTTFQSNKGNVL